MASDGWSPGASWPPRPPRPSSTAPAPARRAPAARADPARPPSSLIVATVTLYGLTAALGGPPPRASPCRRAAARRSSAGDDFGAQSLARALRSAGLGCPAVGPAAEADRDRIRRAGLCAGTRRTARRGNRGSVSCGGRVTHGNAALLARTTRNALASRPRRADAIDGPIYRLAPPDDSHGVVSALHLGGEVLFPAINRSDVDSRYADGGSGCTRPAGPLPPDQDSAALPCTPTESLVPPTAERPAHPHRGRMTLVAADCSPAYVSRRLRPCAMTSSPARRTRSLTAIRSRTG